MRKLVRIGSNVKIPGDSHYKNKNIVLTLLKKIEMRKMTMPNFCINFLNKAAKSLSILYDFAVASLADAWIKIDIVIANVLDIIVASLADAWIKIDIVIANVLDIIVASLADAWIKICSSADDKSVIRRIPRGCVD